MLSLDLARILAILGVVAIHKEIIITLKNYSYNSFQQKLIDLG